MHILDVIDLTVPAQSIEVDFFTVDPETLSFVSFGSEIEGSDNTGKIIPVYVITTENIQELTLSVSSSVNITAKIKTGVSLISGFNNVVNNNTITVSNIQQNTPHRITLFLMVNENTYDSGDLEIIWSY